ncbi:MAG: SHOCT domain-containing protein [Marivibrio sp.]|uniref:SHOCT domain-containing protein n=1 Tax=Marivibrio sp. TaxID=2039719 RepID=UPI0032F09AF1
MTAFRLLSISGALTVLAPAAAMAQTDPGYGGPHMWGGGWHGWGLGPFGMILILALLVGLVLLVLRRSGADARRPHSQEGGEHDAMTILRARFARGEIDREEFEARRKVLEG